MSTRIRDTLQSAIVSVKTTGSLCGASNPVASWLLKVTGRCLIWLLVVLSPAALDPSVVTATLGSWGDPLIIMLIRLLGGGGRLSSLRSSARSLFGDFISVRFSFFISRSVRVGSLLGDVLR